MKKLVVVAAAVLLLSGAGCFDKAAAPETQTGEVDEVVQNLVMDDYELSFDPTYSFQKNPPYTRIQNYSGSDDPEFAYEPGAFFVEFNDYPNMTLEGFTSQHGLVETVTLGGEEVVRGSNRTVAENSWPGHSYFNQARGMAIYLYYQEGTGGQLAEELVQSIKWR